MTTQHLNPRRRIRAGAALSGTALAAVLMVAAPGAAIAHAHGYSTPSGDAVGRPGFGTESTPGNPAPGVRAVQALGDRVFNQNTAFNKSLDDSPLGTNYHNAFGTPNYEHPTHGSNGTVTGLLNGGLIKTTYDSLQARGAALPDEADLSAAVIRQLSGHHVTITPHRSPSAAVKSCTAQVAKTSLRAQGSC
ncbi:hypothetical protein [Mycolicibacterium aichiense]|uniref:Superoxide dismutase n=1 Tax=Mycolicibacterium aichiense TaxID=1799 RepID=A0AAD1MBV3_9MYCO|nr:hypothetical protein [Mycolicibacterium aichiense]MCV7018173.1 hypothetical protein [Mycolicibacterium aichiense]BBX07126.1 hypothetical protein MAIC_19290 [Mycolicibacterium aichiense]STZ80941.1 Uncharacterised protein [Mycolicibacterium aichiense]